MFSSRNRFQYQVATGRLTLPVAAILTLIVWTLSSVHDWLSISSLLAYGLTSYLLIETETKFVLIRTRTTLPAVLFLLLYAAMPFLHETSLTCILPVLFILMLLFLFRSYESPYASGALFQAFFCLGISSFILPALAWLTPLLYIHTISLRSLNIRSFFAGIIGFTLPYWLLFGYYVWTDDLEAVYPYLMRLFQFQPINYHTLTLTHYVSWSIVLIFSGIYGTLYLRSAFKDKVQTRILLRIFVWMMLWLNLLCVLQPQYFQALLPLMLIPASLISAHYFALTFNRVSHILFNTTLILWVSLCLFNLWMHFFNF